jgi:hypothetical protein
VNSPDKRPKSSKTAQIPAFRVEKPSQILSEQLQVHPQIPHLPMVVDVEQEPFGKKIKFIFGAGISAPKSDFHFPARAWP